MLSRWLQRAVRSARVYDLSQFVAGNNKLLNRLNPRIRSLPAGSYMADFGGGTGLPLRARPEIRYVCLDLDRVKLQRFRSKGGGGLAVVADATHCPLKTNSVDVVLCSKVAHHLNDETLHAMLAEAARLVKPGGSLILADPTLSDRRIARLLWRLDRGCFPRTADAIRMTLPKEFVVTFCDRFRASIFHDFVICVAQKARADGSTDSA